MNNPAQLPNAKNPIRTSLAHALTDLQSVALIAARQFAIPLLLLGAGLMLVQPCAATPFQWEYTGSLNTARGAPRATLLSNGRVLVIGGYNIASAELYDPATGNWAFTGSLTSEPLSAPLLLTSGQVLVAGEEDILTRAELYNPATGTWSVTGSLNTGRVGHSITRLFDGRVLVAGGAGTSAELYDPAAGTWTFTGSLNVARSGHTATLLSDGRVLVVDGSQTPTASAELYDPAMGNWTLTGSLITARFAHTATLLADGKVLVAGGIGGPNVIRAELYDPITGNWTVTGRLNTGRFFHTATLLPDGNVLLTGGLSRSGARSPEQSFDDLLASAELYDPGTGRWTLTGSLNDARFYHVATLLPNGRVLAAGGETHFGILASAELYDAGIATTVEGRGAVDNNGNEVTFKLRASQPNGDSRHNLFSFCDPAASVCLTDALIRGLSITGNTADFQGSAHLEDGTEVRFRVSVTDNGLPGTSDTISISLSNGYSVSGTLISGDIRIY